MSTFWLCVSDHPASEPFSHVWRVLYLVSTGVTWKWKSFSCVPLFVTPWTVASQTPLSIGILYSRILEWVDMPSSRGSFQPRSPTLQVDSLPSEPPGKPKNTGVSSQSLLQGIFLTQELNCGLLHCRRISYQLSYQRSSFSGIQDMSTHPRINQPHWHQV